MKFKSVEIPQERMKNKSDPFNENELKSYRTLIGQLSWIASQSRPDITKWGFPKRLHTIFNGQNRKIISNNVTIKADPPSYKKYDGCRNVSFS